MTKRDPLEDGLTKILQNETMPTGSIASTLALVHGRASTRQVEKEPEGAVEEGPTLAVVPDRHTPHSQQAGRPKTKRRPRFAQLLAACLVAVALTAVGVASATETGQMAIEGRASAELGVNCWGRVVRVWSGDADVETQLKNLNLIGLGCGEALSRIAEHDGELFSDTHGVALVASCDSASQRQTLLQDAEGASALFGEDTSCSSYDGATRREAQEAQMGLARYAVYQEITALDPSVTLEQCRDLSMRQLQDMLDALREGRDAEANSGLDHGRGQGGAGMGRGQGMGNGAGYGHRRNGQEASPTS